MDLPTAFLISRKQTRPFNPPKHGHPKFDNKQKQHDSPAKGSIPDTDLAERPQKADDDDNDRKSSPSPKDKSGSAAKSKSTKTTEVDANAVPVPAPDTGVHVSAIHPGILPVIPSQAPTTLTVPAHSVTSGFSPLPPLTALVTTTALSGTLVPTGSPTGTSRALSDAQADSTSGHGSKHLPVVLIVLVSVGVVFFLLGAFIVYRARTRPRQRSCPTPSLPIFQDPFADQDMKVDDESLFGGKERASAVVRPNSNGLWTWTQYTPKPSAQALGNKAPTFDLVFPDPPRPAPTALFFEKNMPPLPPPPAPAHVPPPSNPATMNPPLQQMQSALTRAANRVSALSMSIYPASPQSTSGIGLALGGMSPLTADGTPVLQRKPSTSRLSKSRRSMRHSLAATEYLDMQADIYGGAQVASPFPSRPAPEPAPTSAAPTTPLPKPALRKSTSISVHGQNQGRARVKAPYTPGAGAVLRSSSTVAGITTLARGAGNRSSVMVPSGEREMQMQYALPPLSPALKSDGGRERDTRALTSAMGLASPGPDSSGLPMPVSPQPTLYPDDSITLAGDRQRPRPEDREHQREKGTTGRSGTHHRVQSEAMSPGMEASARLGNLMLAEFTSMASLPSTRTVANAPGTTAGSSAKSRGVPRKTVNARAEGQGRTDDKPPRVPSPPPLPSLAQMAMAHANAQEYADYRSPTYSIYGLYEAERKSRMPSEAGF
ncbi:hypothetical protein BV20DRAFT_986829 [Pilatotrama ljubarskyi]|nr:hypothetical protein BV20DRAFT_986829 [Pilatotrama ljubarskyi]